MVLKCCRGAALLGHILFADDFFFRDQREWSQRFT